MITNIINAPHFYTHAWGPVIFGCISDQVSQMDFKYVFDIWIRQNNNATTKIGTIKQYPNPAQTGIIDVQPVVQPYILAANSINFEVNNAIGATFPFINLSSEYLSVYVKVGEEYRTGGTQNPLVIYDGLVTDQVGSPAYNIGNRLIDYPVTDTILGSIILPGSANFNVAYTHQTESVGATNNNTGTSYPTNIGTYPVGYFSQYTFPSSVGGFGLTGLGEWLTESGDISVVSSTDQATLSYINFNPAIMSPAHATGASGFNPQVVINADNFQCWPSTLNVNFFNAAGGSLGSTSINNLTGLSGGAWGATADMVSSNLLPWSNLWNYPLMAINTSPTYWSTKTGISLTGMDHYTFQFFSEKYTNTAQPLSNIYTYYIRNQDATQYPRIRFSWLNKLGGRDYFNFTQYFEKNVDQEINTYWKEVNNWSSATWSLSPWNGGNIAYSKAFTNSITITTDYLNQSQVIYLKSLFESPSIHVWLDDSTVYPTPCQIKDTSYKIVQQLLNKDKLQQVTFMVELGISDRVQTG